MVMPARFQLKQVLLTGLKRRRHYQQDEVNSTVDLTLTKQTGTGNRFVFTELRYTELSFGRKSMGIK
ncbi:L-shaped tail fiber protein [Escherichia coli]|nr:L-shaped tail fiber protein [Escherichia coli]